MKIDETKELYGVVTFWNNRYGFIKGESEDSFFFHSSDVVGKDKVIHVGAKCEFFGENSDRGLKAILVKIL